jgi:threonine/homoserine/homoserine lactone efflux protein
MARALVLGFLVGFPIAASPGPMFFLVLRRIVARGWRSGLVSGLGIATGDAIYAAIAAFGVVVVINLLVGQRRWIGLVGGIAIAFIGLQTLVRRGPHPDPAHAGNPATLTTVAPPQAGEGKTQIPRQGMVVDYAATLGLTLSNPPTIVSFLAVFAGLGVHVGSGRPRAIALVAGVMLGSAFWWVLLTALVSLLRRRISPTVSRAIGVISGLALIVFGVLITLQAL